MAATHSAAHVTFTINHEASVNEENEIHEYRAAFQQRPFWVIKVSRRLLRPCTCGDGNISAPLEKLVIYIIIHITIVLNPPISSTLSSYHCKSSSKEEAGSGGLVCLIVHAYDQITS